MGKIRSLARRVFPGFFYTGSLVFVFAFTTGLAAPAPKLPRTIFIGAGTDAAFYRSSSLPAVGLVSTMGTMVYAGFDVDSVTSIRIMRGWGTIEPIGRWTANGLMLERVLRDRVSAGLGYSIVKANPFILRFFHVIDTYGRVAVIKLPRSSLDILVGIRTVYIQDLSEMGLGPRLAVTANGIL